MVPDMVSRLAITVGGMFVLGALLMAVGHYTRNTESSQRRADWIKYGIYLGVVGGMLAAVTGGRSLTAALLAMVAVAVSLELFYKLRLQYLWSAPVLLLLFAVFGGCLSHLLFADPGTWQATFTYVFLLVTFADSFSQLWGRILGRHRMCPRLSPGKTWEGCLGGFLSTVAGAWLLSFLLPGLSPTAIISLGILVYVSATVGDLAFSAIKRRLYIKDFSNLLPGHGGLLDRFDSLIITAPVFYWTSRLLLN
jgi:phosphatidate cytidylyltransferase